MANSRERIFASECRCGSPRPCRQRSRPMRHSSLSLAVLALALALWGCSNIDALRTPPPPQRSENAVEDRDTVAAVLMASTFQSMQHLAQSGPAEQAENERLLQSGEQHADHDRTATTQRRLQAELDENARLRKQLEDAQSKLDAIANIERNLTERKPATEGGQP